MEEHEYPLVPRDELDRRHDALRRRLPQLGVDLLLVSSNVNLLYLTGSMQEGLLAVSPKLPQPVYLARRVYDRAREESALENVWPAVSPSKLCETLGVCPVRNLGLELAVTPHAWAERLRRAIGGDGVGLVDVSGALREVRAVKSQWEVRMLERAAGQSSAAFSRVPEVLREGMTEVELSVEILSTMRGLGWEGLTRMHRFGNEMFLGGVLSGPSAARPTFQQAVIGGWGLSPALPHGASRRRIRRGEPITVDLCGVHMGYITDETRTFSIGPLPEALREAQSAGEQLLRTLEREVRPGAPLSSIWERALGLAVELGVAEGFMGVGRDKLRFIGHGVGLELDELPVVAEGVPGTMPEGATIALEPKLVYPGVGVLGEENTYSVTASGLRIITRARRGLLEV